MLMTIKYIDLKIKIIIIIIIIVIYNNVQQ